MPLVYGTCLKYLKNTSDAEDAVMDIYEKLRQKLLSADIKHFKSWLYVVTKNHCFETLRSRKSRETKEKEVENMYSTQVFHPDDVENKEQIKLLHECLQKLSKFQKDCVDLFYFEKLTYMEIAQKLSIGYSQVRSNIQNGRRNLKLCLEKQFPNQAS